MCRQLLECHSSLASGRRRVPGRRPLVAVNGTVFGGERTALSRSSGLVGASLTATKGGFTAFAKFRADLADGWNHESAAVGVRVAF